MRRNIKITIKVTDNLCIKKDDKNAITTFFSEMMDLYISEVHNEGIIIISGMLIKPVINLWEMLTMQKEIYVDFYIKKITLELYDFFCELIHERNTFDLNKTPNNNIGKDFLNDSEKEFRILKSRRKK